MKKLFMLALFLSGLIFSAQANEGYFLKGTIQGEYTGYIYLFYDSFKDSALIQNNTFEFTGKLKKPVHAWMHLKPPANVEWIYLENSAISVQAEYKVNLHQNEFVNFMRFNEITGSDSQKLLDQYRAFCNANRTKEDFNALHFQELKLMFVENPKSPVNGWILGDLAVGNPVFTYGEFLDLYSLLDTAAMQRYDIRMITTGLRTMTKFGIGQPFVAFELPDQTEKVINSTKYSGKVILIDFWASWCGPCRAKHPELVELQKKYQNKNFNIVSISIDKDKIAWNKAITKDNLTWENLLDADSKITNELGIQSIPFSYLLDEDGNIFAINQPLEKIDMILQEKLK